MGRGKQFFFNLLWGQLGAAQASKTKGRRFNSDCLHPKTLAQTGGVRYPTCVKDTPKPPLAFERFRELVRHVVNVPGAAVKQQIERERQARKKQRTSKTSDARASRPKS